MKKSPIILLFVFILFSACKGIPTEKTIWINDQTISCFSFVKIECLEIQYGEEIDPDKWEAIYGSIEGFTFEPGKKVKLKIRERVMTNPPADGSNVSRKLVKVLEIIESGTAIVVGETKLGDRKEHPKKVGSLNGKWVLISLRGVVSSDLQQLKRKPELEFNGNDFDGNDSCNLIGGAWKGNQASSFEVLNIIESSLICLDKTVSLEFQNELYASKSYKKETGILRFYDSKGIETMVFRTK